MSGRGFILVVEDDEILGASLEQRLALEGWHVRWAKTCAEALEAVGRQTPDAVMCDIRLPDGDGESLMRGVFARAGAVPTIFMTAYGGIDQAVRLVRMGARDYVAKPFEIDEVVDKLGAATAGADAGEAAGAAREESDAGDPFASFGLSPATAATRRTLERVADVDLPVLLTGETGTGKEVAARFLHATSRRAAAPFLAVNCAALAPELVDSALFGHEKGAFTGASERRLGLAETAGEGTLFLDEIGELDASLQAKLLRLVQERELMRVGGTRPIPFTARLVCATHRDLEAEVARGGFREDLWYRINVLTVRIPPLRERPDEIAPLLARFAAEAGPRLRGVRIAVATDAEAAARGYDWPGNVRELKNRVERAVALCEGAAIEAADLFPDARPGSLAAASAPAAATAPAPAEGLTLAEVREAAEKAHIEAVLRATGNGIQETAQRLGVSRTTLWEKMRRLGISVDG
ncbi:sigma-54-dependent transcriptional regulator [Salinarimonas ramus]|uniref:Sigma-54-dependent Fis family transcriptional regulator n=1 Tax=Salinarimonas ramus TaxID=690164 RepID=A0A917Q5T9_9HYPH|nr:sigma-54 dependent transcriptional regulator [Salinarimonas ramus]GGK29072.1 sigma-54-dependent Fis family transcriptional regulator [Salinarimonas ramus]